MSVRLCLFGSMRPGARVGGEIIAPRAHVQDGLLVAQGLVISARTWGVVARQVRYYFDAFIVACGFDAEEVKVQPMHVCITSAVLSFEDTQARVVG